jgi:hypothetical protein
MKKLTQLDKHVAALRLTKAVILHELCSLYPEGKTVKCWLQHGQVTPSIGTVIGYDGGEFAIVLIRLDSRTRQVRRVPVRDILP